MDQLDLIIKECEDTEEYLLKRGNEETDRAIKAYFHERARIYGSLASKLRNLRRRTNLG
jgi:hypothetical protein